MQAETNTKAVKYTFNNKHDLARYLRDCAKWFDTHRATIGWGFPNGRVFERLGGADPIPPCGCSMAAMDNVLCEANGIGDLSEAKGPILDKMRTEYAKLGSSLMYSNILGSLAGYIIKNGVKVPELVFHWNDHLPAEEPQEYGGGYVAIRFLTEESCKKIQATFREAAWMVEHGASFPLDPEDGKRLREKNNAQRRHARLAKAAKAAKAAKKESKQ